MRNIDALNNNIHTFWRWLHGFATIFFSITHGLACDAYKAICCIVLHWGSEIHSSVSQKLGVGAKCQNQIGWNHSKPNWMYLSPTRLDVRIGLATYQRLDVRNGFPPSRHDKKSRPASWTQGPPFSWLFDAPMWEPW